MASGTVISSKGCSMRGVLPTRSNAKAHEDVPKPLPSLQVIRWVAATATYAADPSVAITKST